MNEQQSSLSNKLLDKSATEWMRYTRQLCNSLLHNYCGLKH